MQETKTDLTTDWVKLSDIITVDSSKTYYIQNRGNGILWLSEGSSVPTDGGIFVENFKIAEYKQGEQDLYLRSYSGTLVANISSEG